jgi:hypothetical protein
MLPIDSWSGLSVGPETNFQPLNASSELVGVEPSGKDDLRNASSARSSLVEVAKTEGLSRPDSPDCLVEGIGTTVMNEAFDVAAHQERHGLNAQPVSDTHASICDSAANALEGLVLNVNLRIPLELPNDLGFGPPLEQQGYAFSELSGRGIIEHDMRAKVGEYSGSATDKPGQIRILCFQRVPRTDDGATKGEVTGNAARELVLFLGGDQEWGFVTGAGDHTGGLAAEFVLVTVSLQLL